MRLLIAVLAFAGAISAAQAETCTASHYGVGDGYGGRRTASGERMNPHAMTAAHKTLPFGSLVVVSARTKFSQETKLILVRINDRGPFVRGRCIDLSTGAMRKLCGRAGTCRVTVSR